jgi:hypothetical protein
MDIGDLGRRISPGRPAAAGPRSAAAYAPLVTPSVASAADGPSAWSACSRFP